MAKWTSKINVKPIQNRYYDLHFFFNTLISKAFFPQFMTEDVIPQEAKDFVNRMVPLKFRKGKYVSERGRILKNNEIRIPDEVLKKDPFFEDFRNHKLKKGKKKN